LADFRETLGSAKRLRAVRLASFSHKVWVPVLSALMLPVEGRAQALSLRPLYFFGLSWAPSPPEPQWIEAA
jgi:hypothetical protein